MSKKKRSRPAPRAEPVRRSIAFAGADLWESIECRGYVSLAQNPEICTAVDTIARLIESMTIHLMENTEAGDVRVKNELSRKVDISPNNNMTRAAFIHWIVKTLMLEGNGNAARNPARPQTGAAGFYSVRPGRHVGLSCGDRRAGVRPGRRAALCFKSRKLLPVERRGLPRRADRRREQSQAGGRYRKRFYVQQLETKHHCQG